MTDIYGTLEIMKLPEDKWELLSNPMFRVECLGNYVVKPLAGFIYDGGSVPQAFWSLGLTPVGSDADFAFLLHDWLYSESRRGSDKFTRLQADQAMLEVMEYCGVNPLIAYGAYSAVRGAAYTRWGDGSPDEPNILLEDPEGYEWFRE